MKGRNLYCNSYKKNKKSYRLPHHVDVSGNEATEAVDRDATLQSTLHPLRILELPNITVLRSHSKGTGTIYGLIKYGQRKHLCDCGGLVTLRVITDVASGRLVTHLPCVHTVMYRPTLV